MDLEVKIKEEPAWFEGRTNASLENIEYVSEVIALKEEVKSELTEPGSSQENSLELSKDIKEELFIEEHTDDQLLPYIKEETKSRPEVSNADYQAPDGGAPCSGCNVCGKILVRNLGLLRQLKRHEDNRPFKCDNCGKLFGSGSSLSEDLKIHPLLVCEFCHKDHMQIRTFEKPYCCNVCGKYFSQRTHLAHHMRTGTGEKPYCCNFCGKSFSKKILLANHLRKHTGVKPYRCNVCGKSFRGKCNLAWHLPIHTENKAY